MVRGDIPVALCSNINSLEISDLYEIIKDLKSQVKIILRNVKIFAHDADIVVIKVIQDDIIKAVMIKVRKEVSKSHHINETIAEAVKQAISCNIPPAERKPGPLLMCPRIMDNTLRGILP